MSTGAGARRDPTLPATAALTALTVAVALGFGRLFADAGFVGPVLLAALTGHGVAWAGRRRGLSTPVAAVATVTGVALVALWTVLPHATIYGIPGTETLRAAAEELARAQQDFGRVVAPARVLPGFVLATALAVGVAGFMADWAAFRVHATFEACIPAFTLFLFTAALGSPRHRGWAVAAFVAGVLGFLLTHRFTGQVGARSWFGGRPGAGVPALLRVGGALGVTAIVVGLVVGPALPGAGEPPLISYRNRQRPGPASRSTVSPLVDIRGRLVDRSGVEVFTVQSNERAYWRLTALDTFDGTIWSSNETYRRARGPLTPDLPVPVSPGGSRQAVQEFQVRQLGSLWLPAAYRPVEVTGPRDASYNPATASLISSDEVSDGLRYRVRSEVPDPSPETLASSAGPIPRRIAADYLTPPSVSARVAQEARRITAGARSPYARARALQDHFQANFRYDLGVRLGHDARALETFLFSARRGYCEQFAGAYAVLARLVGLPSRVAVGFTPGDLGADGLYHVRDEHAHAWPEVYLQGHGWVAFEPTPGRGAPGAEDYTGVPEAQETADPATTATTAPSTATTGAEDAPGPGDPPETPEGDEGTATGPSAPGKPSLLRRVLTALGAVAVAAVAWGVGIPLLVRRRRARRHATAATPSAQVLACWEDAHHALAQAGLARRPAETLREYAARVARSPAIGPAGALALAELARDTAAASYAGAELAPEVADRARGAANRVVLARDERAGRLEKLRWALDPRPLLPRAGPHDAGPRRRRRAA
jgi:transglutaminase-like putative cysteine protease